MSKNLPFRRLCIYFFFDPDGLVDEYVLDCLREMSLHTEKILLVSNSPLQPASKQALKTKPGLSVAERPNTGFDVWAYKHGIDMLGWKELETYDEVILMNFTIVGPVHPFAEMFSAMKDRPVDFWGINVHSGENYDPWGTMPNGFIPKHLQSHFIVYRKRLLKSQHLRAYWANMRPITSYHESVGFHEAIFTPTFKQLGFAWDSYIQSEDLEHLTSYPLIFMPREILAHRRCPFFKRKAFILPFSDYTGCTMGQPGRETIDVLRELGYDISKLLPNILRTANQYDIRLAINASHVLPPLPPTKRKTASLAAAFVIYLDSNLKFEALQPFMHNLLSSGKVFVVLGGRHKASLQHKLQQYPDAVVREGTKLDFVSLILRVGRQHSHVGVLSFNSYSPNYTGLGEVELYQHGIRSLFADQATLASSLAVLNNNSLYGGLAAPLAVHSGYGRERYAWGKYHTKTKRVLEAIRNPSLLDKTKAPLSSESGMFLLRGSALAAVPGKALQEALETLPPSQMQTVFCFALPFILQHSGGLLAYALPLALADTYQTVLSHSIEYGQLPLPAAAPRRSMVAAAEPAEPPKPKGTLYFMRGGTFSEKHRKTSRPITKKDGTIRYTFTVPYDTARCRFDPAEGVSIIGRNIHATVNGTEHKLKPAGALTHNGAVDIFFSKDPQYFLNRKLHKGDRVVITFDSLAYYTPDDVLAATPGASNSRARLQSAIGDIQYYRKHRAKRVSSTK